MTVRHMYISSKCIAEFQQIKKWHSDLFSPKGLQILFGYRRQS